MSGLLPGIGEDCGAVYIILNLSAKGRFIELPVKNSWIDSRINKLSEGRNQGEREEKREGGKGNWEEAQEAAVSGHCLLSLAAFHVIAWWWWGSCDSCYVINRVDADSDLLEHLP